MYSFPFIEYLQKKNSNFEIKSCRRGLHQSVREHSGALEQPTGPHSDIRQSGVIRPPPGHGVCHLPPEVLATCDGQTPCHLMWLVPTVSSDVGSVCAGQILSLWYFSWLPQVPFNWFPQLIPWVGSLSWSSEPNLSADSCSWFPQQHTNTRQ